LLCDRLGAIVMGILGGQGALFGWTIADQCRRVRAIGRERITILASAANSPHWTRTRHARWL
jgi:hypothetical protein